jgi:glycosyltransferase involved in cell wall biosynthesis
MVLVPEATDPGPDLRELPDGALVIVDGLIAAGDPNAMTANASRLRMIVLAHMVASLVPGHSAHLPDPSELIDGERAALGAALRIITTSEWTRAELVARELADPDEIVVAHPGTHVAQATIPSASGGRLLCVGVIAPHKGQDILVAALAGLTELDGWTATFVGSLTTAPGFADELTDAIDRAALSTRVTFTGPLAGAELDAAYGCADLVVVPSRSESYGMVVAEALARGIPVLAAEVGGIREALSGGSAGTAGGGAGSAGVYPAGLVVPAEDPAALEAALREWWSNPGLRAELAAGALAARANVRTWSATVAVIDSVLHDVAHERTVVPA